MSLSEKNPVTSKVPQDSEHFRNYFLLLWYQLKIETDIHLVVKHKFEIVFEITYFVIFLLVEIKKDELIFIDYIANQF